MNKYDQRYIDPEAEQIVASLGKATEAANYRARTRKLAFKPADARKLARQVAAQPEGVEQLRGGRGGVPATQVLAAWWSDRIGRKHVRVVGRRIQAPTRFLLRKEVLATRPALWHVYPERLYVVRGKEEPVAACACGAVGPPDSLGWMGERCGPCQDRYDELLGACRPIPPEPVPLLWGTGVVRSVAFAPDGTAIAYTHDDPGTVRACDILTGAEHFAVKEESGGAGPGVLAFTPDGESLAGIGGDSDLVFWDAATGKVTKRLHPVLLRALAFSPDGRTLLLGGLISFQARVREDNRWVEAYQQPTRALCLAVSPEGSFWVASGNEGSVRACELTTGRQLWQIQAEGQQGNALVQALAISPDGKTVASGRARNEFEAPWAPFTGHVRLWDAANGAARGNVQIHEGDVTGVAFSPDRHFVLSCGSDGTVRTWDLRSNRECPVLEWHLGPIDGMALSPDGRTLATAGSDGAVKLWPWRELIG